MEIYIAAFAGLLGALLLAVVYLADRYEREPIELIQNAFLTGMMGQLALVLAAAAITGNPSWSGPWILVTVGGAALYLPFHLRDSAEMDERFDGIVYSVALLGGAVCVIHLANLPGVIAASPYRAALDLGAEPDLRDLLIIAGSAGFTAELGRGLVVILIAVLVGSVLGPLQLRGNPPWKTAVVVASTGLSLAIADVATGGAWILRGPLAAAAVGAAVALKQRSVFRDRPEPAERDVLIMALKTVLVVFGAVLLAMVLLQALVEQPEPVELPVHTHTQPLEPGP
jgi:hypothetical protein